MRNRIIVHLSPNERTALQQMAEHDFRAPNEQVRLLIVTEATRRGLLVATGHTDATEIHAGAVPTWATLLGMSGIPDDATEIHAGAVPTP